MPRNCPSSTRAYLTAVRVLPPPSDPLALKREMSVYEETEKKPSSLEQLRNLWLQSHQHQRRPKEPLAHLAGSLQICAPA
jgi:hypothetical protein